MAYDPSIFNINPYYDDYDIEKAFLRILFKPGYALQARELTQTQTILQNQISKVSDHLFKDGSRIIGGGITVRNSSFIKVDPESGDIATLSENEYPMLVGGLLTDTQDTSIKARVVHYISPEVGKESNLTLVVDFISGQKFTGNTVNFVKGNVQYFNLSVATIADPIDSNCKLVTVSDGIFYIDGFFVKVDTQSFSPYSIGSSGRDLNFNRFSALDKKIGFLVQRDSVTEQEDFSLRDPAIGSYNYNAPGADRYKIVLSLTQYELDETPDDFIELLRFEGGKITRKADKIVYGDIQKALATRTYDESGSYTTKPFDLTIKPNFDERGNFVENKLTVSVGDGKAYVYGYEIENIHPNTGIVIDKARSTSTETNKSFAYTVGNYVDGIVGDEEQFGITFASNLITIGSGSALAKFYSENGQEIASAYVHGAIPSKTNPSGVGHGYRFYVYGLQGNISGLCGAYYAYVYNHGGSGETFAYFTPPQGETTFSVSGVENQSLVYELEPGYAVKSVDNLRVIGKIIGGVAPTDAVVAVSPNTPVQGKTTFTITKSHFSSTIATQNSTSFKFLTTGTGVNLENTTDIQQVSFVNTATGNSFTPTRGLIYTDQTDSTLTLVVDGVPEEFGSNSSSLRAIAPIVYTPLLSPTLDYTTIRTKRYVTDIEQSFSSLTYSTDDSNSRKYFLLNNTDVLSVSSVSYTDEDGTVVDITDHFELDDGQRDSYYDYGRVYVKEFKQTDPLYTTNNVSIVVVYSYFEHTGTRAAPFVGAYSYIYENSGLSYDNIPLFTSSRTGKTVSLANCLDFRHSTPTSTIPMIKPYGVSEFGGTPGNTIVSYTHYLPRMDKVCVKVDPDDSSPLFFAVQGTPDLSPVAPPDPDNSLVLATLTVPAYTHNTGDITITPVDNKRFTMADIGKINKRIDEVELFSKLSLSESEIESRSLSAGGDEPVKTSIFSDEFYGHSIGDVANTEYSCSIDYERGELRPFFNSQKISFIPSSISGATISSDGILTVNYTGITYINNTQYTTKVKINPSGTVNWLGFMKLTPTVDSFYDPVYRPVVKTNALGENDNWLSANPNNADGYGTQWNDWESIWTGIDELAEEQDDIQRRIVSMPHSVSDSAVPSINNGSVRVGVSRTLQTINQKKSNYIRSRNLKNRIKYTVGSRVVDRSVVPYISSREISGVVYGLKPLVTNLTAYFDGEAVQTGLNTDENGTCSFSFTIPNGKFLAGSRTVRISDSPIVYNSTTSADAVYHCTGLLEQRGSGVYSTRPAEMRRLLTSSDAVAKDPFNRDVDTVENTHWSDPLAQTFFVDRKTNPNGIFLNSVTLYFSAKDSQLPVTVQIRPTVSGYPSPSVVIPYSTSTKLSEEVQIGSTPKATTFKFSSPVYLEPGEYALCILTNSGEYELFAADSAINAVATNASASGRAGNNQLVGTLYSSQGIGPCVANNVLDIMFSVEKCNFSTATGTVVWSTTNCIGSQILKVYAPEIVPEGCILSRSVGSIPFLNNESLYLNQLFGSNPSVTHTLNVGVDTDVSPVVDVGAICGISVKMYRNSQPSSYISRIVELPEDLVSNGIAVFLDGNTPAGSSISVEYRYIQQGESDILVKPWIPMTRITPEYTSTTEIDFRESQYRTDTGSNTLFQAYQVRVKLNSVTSPVYAQTPSVRNIRVVSYRG